MMISRFFRVAACLAVALVVGASGRVAQADFNFRYYTDPTILNTSTPPATQVINTPGTSPLNPGSAVYEYTTGSGVTTFTITGVGSGNLVLDANPFQNTPLATFSVATTDSVVRDFSIFFEIDMVLQDPSLTESATVTIGGLLAGRVGGSTAALEFLSFAPEPGESIPTTLGGMPFEVIFLGGSAPGLIGTTTLTAQVVPEPASLALTGLGGLFGVVFALNRRRAARLSA